MAKYDYVNYSQLSDDQKTLWWFDEYLCYDLVFSHVIEHNFAFCVQRYTIYNYPWANDYSGLLFELFSQTPFLRNLIYDIYTSATITIDGIPDGETVVVTYLEQTAPVKLPILDYLWMDFPIRYASGVDLSYLQKSHRLFTAKDNGTTIKISLAKYSAVITGIGVTIDGDSMYSNKQQWMIGQPPVIVTVPLSKGIMTIQNRVVTNEESTQEVDVSNFLLTGTHLIYANPPDSLFNGLFKLQKQGIGVNRSAGNSGYDINDIMKVICSGFYSFTPESPTLIVPTNEAFYTEDSVIHPNVTIITQWEVTFTGLYSYSMSVQVHSMKDGIKPQISDEFVYTYSQADTIFKKLLLQTALISSGNSNLREILRVNEDNQPIDENDEVTDDPDRFIFDINEDYIEEYVMGLELMIQEIHACLGAEEFAYSTNDQQLRTPAFMNVARKVDYIAKALGINFGLSGNIKSTRPSKHLEQGQTIPAGWNFAQFGRNEGGTSEGQEGGIAGEERLGIVYQVKSNELVFNTSTGEVIEIKQGGYLLCESIPQYVEVMQMDLDKALDWQSLGGGLINFNGKTLVTEGLFDLLQEMAVVEADTNQTTEQSRISSLVTQQLVKEVLKGLGLPTTVKKFDFQLQSNDQTWRGIFGQSDVNLEVPYNGVADQSPTIVSLLFTLLENIAMGNIAKFKINETETIKGLVTEPTKEIIPTHSQYPVANPVLVQDNDSAPVLQKP